MKRAFSVLLLPFILTLTLAACGRGESPPTVSGDVTVETQSDSTAQTPINTPAAGFTVRFMDGDTELKSETVESGKTATEYTPEKEGSAFVGWFATPGRVIPYDFNRPVTEDTQIFAGFSVYQDDTRDFYVVGSGKSPQLLSSSWGASVTDEHKMKKASGKNEYTLTMDVFEGDQFQFAINGQWQNQRGFGYLVTGLTTDGKGAFTGDGGFGDSSAKNKNITCALDGNYTFTLTTFPADDVYDETREGYSEENKESYNQGTYDTITFVRNGEPLAAPEVQYTYYIKGETITGWADVYDDTTKMVSDGAGKHSLTVSLAEGEPFLFTSTVSDGTVDSVGSEYLKYHLLDNEGKALFEPQNTENPDDSNLKAIAAGTYTFVYDQNTKVLGVTKN